MGKLPFESKERNSTSVPTPNTHWASFGFQGYLREKAFWVSDFGSLEITELGILPLSLVITISHQGRWTEGAAFPGHTAMWVNQVCAVIPSLGLLPPWSGHGGMGRWECGVSTWKVPKVRLRIYTEDL